jgi:hypothetical protein
MLATFSGYRSTPTAYAWIHGAPAHVSSFQTSNLAVCSMNFDDMGSAKRTQAYVHVVLGRAGEVDEVNVPGGTWDGDPAAIGSRGTVAVRRGNVMMAITLLDSGVATAQTDTRRKPGVLEWVGQGEYARLTLTIYARQEDYTLRRSEDDWRAGFVVQMWTADQFDGLDAMVRWLNVAKIGQTFQTAVTKTELPQDYHPIMDKGKLLPKPRVVKLENRLHTIDYSYDRGRGNSFRLVEDIRNEAVRERAVNGQPLPPALWWYSPRLYWTPKQALEVAFTAPAPAPPAPPAPPAGAATDGSAEAAPDPAAADGAAATAPR